jgi:hypothetical protein
VGLEGLGKLKKSTSSGTRTGDLPACSIVLQPTMLPRALDSVSKSDYIATNDMISEKWLRNSVAQSGHGLI